MSQRPLLIDASGATQGAAESIFFKANSDSLQDIVFNQEAIVHWNDSLIDFQTATYPGDGKFLAVGGGGDSMGTSSGFNPYVTLELVRRFGQGCVASSSLSSANNFGTGQSTTTVTLGGSAASVADNFTYLPNGEYYSIPVSSSVTETPNSANIGAGYTRVRCWYARRSGGGTISFTVSQNGVALTAKTVDTGTGTAGTIGYVDFTSADGLVSGGKPTLVVESTSATTHYLGCFMYLGCGFIPLSLGRGGSSYAQALTSTAANLATFCAAMDMRLCFHAVKEEDEDWSDMLAMMDRWAAQHPKCSHIWVGATPSPSGDTTTDPASNRIMRQKAGELKMCFVDGQKLLRSVAWLTSIGPLTYGWNESNVAPHLSLFARRFIAGFIIDKVLMGLQVAGGRFSPATLENAALPMLSDTRISANMWAASTVNGASSTFTHTTPDLGRMTIGYNASTNIPVANTYRAGKIMNLVPSMNTRRIYRYVLMDGHLETGIMSGILIGGGSGQSEISGLTSGSGRALRIINGVDIISTHQVPFIQFGIRDSGSTEVVSPKFYHSTATASAPWANGTWRANTENIYWVEYLGNGSSTSKRLRAWHQSLAFASSDVGLAPRRMIADWTGTVTAGGSAADNSVYWGAYTDSSPTTPGGARNVILSQFDVYAGPKFVTDFSQQDFNL
jgi:hypothetical protein